MKATHKRLMNATELGILRSIPDFIADEVKEGRLKNRFTIIISIVDEELKKLYSYDPHFFTDNYPELTVYAKKFGFIMGIKAKSKEDIHVASIIGFCLHFLEDSKSTYPKKLYESLQDILDYYERSNNISYTDLWKGTSFYDKWLELNKGGN